MTMMDIKTLREQLDSNGISVQEVVQQSLDAISTKNEEIFAVIEIYDEETIKKQIIHAQYLIDQGQAGPLTGIPYLLKDNILFEGQQATAASRILAGYTATYDATVTEKLKEQGAICLGRTNMDDSAMGSSTERSCYGPTKNPRDLDYVPGGSSGGSAAAVAAQMVPFTLGSDTGGSIRQPASFTGVVGLKPTYGAVSRSGLIAMGSSLDCIGPLTNTVADARTVFEQIEGEDPMDATTIPAGVRADIRKDIAKVRKIGIPRSFIETDGVDDDVLENFNTMVSKLEQDGYEIITIDLPNAHESLPVYYVIMPAEASTNLARFDGMRYGLSEKGDDLLDTYYKTKEAGYGAEPKRRILTGTFVLSAGYYDAYYGKAVKVAEKIKQEFSQAFEQVDVILTPTTPTTAFKLGEISDPVAMYAADLFTVPANITGIPALSVPSGQGANGLPMGMHIMAPYFHEQNLFEIGKKIEEIAKGI